MKKKTVRSDTHLIRLAVCAGILTLLLFSGIHDVHAEEYGKCSPSSTPLCSCISYDGQIVEAQCFAFTGKYITPKPGVCDDLDCSDVTTTTSTTSTTTTSTTSTTTTTTAGGGTTTTTGGGTTTTTTGGGSTTTTITGGNQYYLVAKVVGANGKIEPSGTVMVNEGASQTFVITPDPGYMVSDVSVDGSSVGAVTSYNFTSVTDNHLVNVEFSLSSGKQYEITATSEGNGSITPSGVVSVSDGGSQLFSISPANGYVVDDVLVNGDSVGAMSNYTFTNVTQNQNISAKFKPGVTPQYTIRATSGDHGRIYPNGDVLVNGGSSKTFEMIPDDGYEVDNLLMDGTSLGAKTTHTLTNVSDDHTIHISFKPITGARYTITASSGNNGSIYPDGEIMVNGGENKSFTMYMAVGYEVEDVWVDGRSVGAVTSHTFQNVRQSHEIHVMFKSNAGMYTITATAGNNGSISPAGEIRVGAGSSKTFTLYMATGYEVADVMVDGVSMGAVNSHTFDNISDDHIIHATFMSPNCECEDCSFILVDADSSETMGLADIIYGLQVLAGMWD